MKNLNINPESLLYIPGEVWVYWKDINGRYLGCNDLMAQALNFNSRQDIIGKIDFDLSMLKKEEVKFYRAADLNVIMMGVARQFQDSATFEDTQLNFLVYKIPLIEANERVVGIAGISYCIDKNKYPDFHTNLSQENNLKSLDNPVEFPSFSIREKEVLNLLLSGKTAKQISKHLHLSKRTIEHYIENIKYKAGVSSKFELIKKFVNTPFLLK